LADVFALTGAWTLTPASGYPSLDPSVSTAINESVQLTAKQVGDLALTSDSPIDVDFGGVTNANVVVLKAVGGPCTLTVTWANGTSQTVPFDSAFIDISLTNPITAMTITRQPATLTYVRVMLGQQA
jgi:hypothetical protein